MLLNMLHMITGFIVLVMRLTIEEIAGEERMILIGQFIQLHGFDVAFEFDLHDLLIILITILIIIFWKAWDKSDRWPYR